MKTILLLLLTATLAFSQDQRALLDLTTGEVLATKDVSKPAAENPNPKRWVVLIRNAQPAFDPATQRLERAVTVAEDKSDVTISWNVVELTQAELDARAAAAALAADRDTKRTNVANAVATLRQWAQDGDGVTVTNGNNNAVTQQLLDRLSIFFDRFADLVESQGITP